MSKIRLGLVESKELAGPHLYMELEEQEIILGLKESIELKNHLSSLIDILDGKVAEKKVEVSEAVKVSIGPEPPFIRRGRVNELRGDLTKLLNAYSMENGSNTPDFVLANFLIGVLDVFDLNVKRREEWHGR